MSEHKDMEDHDTIDTPVKKNGKMWIWKAIEKLVLAIVLASAGWVFHTVNGLEDRMTRMESAGRENQAQWNVLQQHTQTLQEHEIQMEVSKRIFQMLLEQNRIKTDKIALPALPTGRPRTLEDYRTEQMQRYKMK